jgi:choline dehydrogenase-like flavoprotein
MPAVTSGNTAAPTTMIGERCADLIKASLGTVRVQTQGSAS